MEQNAASMWTMWHEELEFYMDAIGVREDDDKHKIAMLLSLAGSESRVVFSQFVFDNVENRKKYEEVVKRFKGHCAPKINLEYERHLFITRLQNERFNAYVAGVRQLAVLCALGDTRYSFVATVIMVGMSDRCLKEKLLRSTGHTLDKIITGGRMAKRD